MYTLHLLEAEPAGDGPEWHASVLRFFEIGEDDVCLMSDWRSYEAAGIRYGRDQVLTRLREFGEAEFVRAPERNVA